MEQYIVCLLALPILFIVCVITSIIKVKKEKVYFKDNNIDIHRN